jgi:uncharacterized protein (DUF305 family)
MSLVIVLVASVVTGCTGAPQAGRSPSSPATYTAPVPVIQPGRPGETATAVAPGQIAQRPQEQPWNAADARFVGMMVEHHTQALRMARLAGDRTSNQQVRAIAARISAAQAPEIHALKAWLAVRNQKLPAGGAGGHAQHGDMPGGVTPARMEALARTSGPAFDRLFLDLMVAHHVGAVQMASAVTTAGTDVTVQEIAAETSAGQSAEIRRMEQVRASL